MTTDTDTEAAPAFELSERAHFEAALQTAKALVDSGALRWRLSGARLVTPRLDEDAVAASVGAAKTPERTRFERVLQREIVPALNRALGSKFAVFGFPRLEKEAQEEYGARLKMVEEALCTESLRRRALIRKTCKGPTLEELRWDISVKKHDFNDGSVPDIPYATIELSFVNPPPESSLAVLDFLGGGGRQAVSFDCHLHDLDDLLKDLMALRSNLERLTQAESS